MDMGTAAGAVRVMDRREAHALPEAPGDRLGELTGDDGVVGGADSFRRRDGDLVLLQAELGEERVRYDTHLPHRGEQTLAEGTLAPVGTEIVGLPFIPGTAAIGEFLLESGEQLDARLALEPLERPAQNLARTKIPGRALRGPDVADEEIFRRTLLERHQNPGAGIRHEEHRADRAERRHLNGAEGRNEHVGGRETHAALQSRGQVGQRKTLAAEVSRQIAGADENNLFALHPSLYIRARSLRGADALAAKAYHQFRPGKSRRCARRTSRSSAWSMAWRV